MVRAIVFPLLAGLAGSVSSPTHAAAPHPRVHAKSKRRSAPKPSYQLHPDPERYREIQQALSDRGYFKGEVNGVWNDDSISALKSFQADQKLENDGKINALTLTGLGLGPKHDGTTAATVPLSANSPAVMNPQD